MSQSLSAPPQPPAGQASYPPQQAGHKFGALAWTALILGIVGIVGSPIIFLNNLTALGAAVGIVLGIIALFGTRKLLAGAGVGLCVAAIAFTVAAQDAAVASFEREFGPISADTASGPPADQDVTVANCSVVDDGYGFVSTQATIAITNNTDQTQSYMITVSVNDDSGARVGEINAFSNSLAAGQTTTLSGMDATGLANDGAEPGPANCTLAATDRFPS